MSIPWGANTVEKHEFDGNALTVQTIYSGVSGKKLGVVRLAATNKAAGQIKVFHGTNIAGKRLVNMHTGAGGGVAWQYRRDDSPAIPDGESIKVISTAGSCAVVCEVLQYDAE